LPVTEKAQSMSDCCWPKASPCFVYVCARTRFLVLLSHRQDSSSNKHRDMDVKGRWVRVE
jgi:hypothetical protein